MIAGVALTAASCADPEKRSVYRFEKSSEGPSPRLTSSEPKSHYLVRAQVTALGPEKANTTDTALATARGALTPSTTDKDARPYVDVQFGAEGQASDAVTTKTGFQLARPIRFTGNCAQPGQGAACQAEIELDFDLDRVSELAEGESVSVDWSVDFESRTFKVEAGGSDEEVEAPWTVEIGAMGAL